MAAFQNFRTALGGFNREDVVQYIEYMNNKHASHINQLKTDLQAAQAELLELEAAAEERQALMTRVEEAEAAKEAAEAEVLALREELEALRQSQSSAPVMDPTASELEAYRRAERAERIAGERVSQMYQQANGALSDAALQADEASIRITDIADKIAQQASELNNALNQSKSALKSAAATLYSIRPISTEE